MEQFDLGLLPLAIVASGFDSSPRRGKARGRRGFIYARRLHDLIEELENGRPVDPLELDRAVSEASTQ